MKKKSVLSKILCLFAFAFAFVAFGAMPFTNTNVVYAEETPYVSITVKAHDEDNKEIELFSDNQTKVNFDNALRSIQNQYYSWIQTYHDFRCDIDLKSTIGIDSVDYGDLPMQININLNGHELQLLYSGYWYIKNGLKIYGSDENGNRGNLTFVTTTEQLYSGSFWVTGGSLEVHDTNISHFNTNKRYPLFAMNTDSSSASFANCSFKDCHSTSYGGAICMDQTNTLELMNCSFENCSSYYGGAVYMEDIVTGGIDFCLRVDNSVFKNCSAYYGGAFYIENNCVWDYDDDYAELQRFYLTNSLIENCIASYDGGGIYLNCEAGRLLSYEFKISKCTAERYGGGVFLDGDSSEISNAEITSCKAKYGGGVYCNDSKQHLTNVCIHDCNATKKGGAYYAEYTSGYDKLRVDGCDFYNNSPSDGNATLMSEGSIVIVSVIGGIALITAGVFIVLYIREKKKKEKA